MEKFNHSRYRISIVSILTLPFILAGASSLRAKPIGLIPAKTNSFEWLLSKHEGAKAIRKGSACLECHDALDPEIKHFPMDITVSKVDSSMVFTLTFKPETDIATVSIMLDDQKVSAFTKTGCWASCHNDLDSMPDSANLQKYIGPSREKLTRSGGGENYKSPEQLAAMMTAREYVSLWQVDLKQATVTESREWTVLEKPKALEQITFAASAHKIQDQWQLVIKRPLKISGQKDYSTPQSYVFNIALHQQQKGREHWVSMPLSFSVKDDSISLD